MGDTEIFLQRIEAERTQLLDQWRRAFSLESCWLSSPPPQVARVLAPETSDRGMAIRKFHDKLGFCAKGSLRRGGLCAGAIFRTRAFIDQPQDDRSGARLTQTVHIEHTVPVRVLTREFATFADVNEPADVALAWLFKHSVATAMKKGQDHAYLSSVTRSTGAFDQGPDNGKPFRRYDLLFADGESVWDVWNRKEIDPDEFCFDTHIDTVLAILDEVGADPNFRHRIKTGASQL